MRTNKSFQRLIIIGFLLAAFVFYTSQYKTELEQLSYDLSDYLRLGDIEIHQMIDPPDQDAYKMILFSSDEGVHVALIHEGINNKYHIQSAYTTPEALSFIDLAFGGYEHRLFYGDFNKDVTGLEILFQGGGTDRFEIDDQPFLRISSTRDAFLTYSNSFMPSDYRVYYSDGSDSLVHLTKRSHNVDTRTSPSSFMIVMMTCFIGFTGFIMVFLMRFSKKSKGPYKDFKNTLHMEKDDQVKSRHIW